MLYVIGDLHLSTAESTNKSMEVFGRRWNGYLEKLKKNWQAVVEEEDSVVIAGDISWALTLKEAASDLHFVDALPGKKYLLKGNHDFFWSTAAKMESFFEEEKITSLNLLHNKAVICEDFILCGTRGWYQDPALEKPVQDTDYEKLMAREAGRLRISLEEGKRLHEEHSEKEMLVFLHFPPIWNAMRAEPIVSLLSEYGIQRCYFGHIHNSYAVPPSFVDNGIRYSLISADFLQFSPRPILPDYFEEMPNMP